MNLPRRKITYRLYPNGKQVKRLEEVSELHRQLYNASLQQRIEAYQRQRKSLSFADQCRELTLLRKECPEFEGLNAQSSQVTLKRIDLAFKNFFRRVKSHSDRPGFPRFKSKDRFPGFGYKSHGDGFKIISKGTHGYVRLSGIGQIRMRGRARTWGEVVTAEILRKTDQWYLSVTVECQPKRKSGSKAFGVDWGVETFSTLAVSDGTFQEIENPRYLKKALKKLKLEQKNLSRKKPRSANRKKACKRLAKEHRKVSQQRKEHSHQVSAEIVEQAALISTEDLKVKNMTASGGNRKKGLNREILNTAPASFISMLKYKAEEAGIEWVEVPTRKVKPTQRCSGCGKVLKKELSERTHDCKACGLKLSRDQNAARVCLIWALTGSLSGWEPTRCGEIAMAASVKQETPAHSLE